VHWIEPVLVGDAAFGVVAELGTAAAMFAPQPRAHSLDHKIVQMPEHIAAVSVPEVFLPASKHGIETSNSYPDGLPLSLVV